MYVEWKVAFDVAVGFVTTKILLLEVSSSLTKATASASSPTKATASASTTDSTSSPTTVSVASTSSTDHGLYLLRGHQYADPVNAIVMERKVAIGAAVAVASAVATVSGVAVWFQPSMTTTATTQIPYRSIAVSFPKDPSDIRHSHRCIVILG